MGTNTKKLKRSKVKHPNLKPTYNLKTRKDLLDFDYLHKLNEEELEFLNKFVGEVIVASFEENNNKNLYKTDKDKRKIYTENNARNRCILTRKKAADELDSIETLVEKETKPESNISDQLDSIGALDALKKKS